MHLSADPCTSMNAKVDVHNEANINACYLYWKRYHCGPLTNAFYYYEKLRYGVEVIDYKWSTRQPLIPRHYTHRSCRICNINISTDPLAEISRNL